MSKSKRSKLELMLLSNVLHLASRARPRISSLSLSRLLSWIGCLLGGRQDHRGGTAR